MQLVCPRCGTRETKVAPRVGFVEFLKGLVGTYPLKCRRCQHRWLTSAWEEGAWKYARCPRCYRQELTTWSERYYHPPLWTVTLLRLGATPYRCPACRCNFASFRPCKERFTWRHELKGEAAIRAARAARIRTEREERRTARAASNGHMQPEPEPIEAEPEELTVNPRGDTDDEAEPFL